MIATPIQTMAPGPPAASPSAGAAAPAAQATGLPSFARTLAQAVTDQQTNSESGPGTPAPDQGGKPPAGHTDDGATLQGLAALSVLLSSLQTAPPPQQGGPAPPAQPSATAPIAAAPAGAAPLAPAVAPSVPPVPAAAVAAGAAAPAEPKPPVAPTPSGTASPAPVAAQAALSPPTPAQAVPAVAPASTTAAAAGIPPAPAPPAAAVAPTASTPARQVDEYQDTDLVTVSAGQTAQSRPSTDAAQPAGPPVPEQPQGPQPGQPLKVLATPADPLTTAAADPQPGATQQPGAFNQSGPDHQPGQPPVLRPAPDAVAPPKPAPAPDPGQTAAVPVALAAKAPPGPRRQETQSPASAAHQVPAPSAAAQPPVPDATLTPLLQAHPSQPGALPAELPGASQPQPVRAEEIIAQVAHQLKLQQVGAHSHLQLQLHPEHLGQLTLRLSMAAGGALHGSVTVAQGAIKAALDGALTELNQVLLEKGVKVSSLTVNVSSQGGQSQGQAAMRDEQRSRQHLAVQQRLAPVTRPWTPAPALALVGSGRRFNALA